MSLPILTFLIFLLALAGLVASSYYFVGGSAALARLLGMRPGVIGLTIVAFGTSAPEILVSASAALEGSAGLGVGNALGSNIANIGLVLAITALIAKLPVHRWLFRMEIPMLAIATALAAYFLFDHELDRLEGAILLVCALLFPVVLLIDIRRHPSDIQPGAASADDEEIPDISLAKSLLWLIGGLLVLLYSADTLVGAATDIAGFFGVSPLIIGLTIVAIGTSLPELAASVTSALRGHKEMAVGNIVGSNILNIYAVMAMPGLLLPSTLEPEVFRRDVAAMSLLTLLLVLSIAWQTVRPGRSSGQIGWPTGLLLLAVYLGFNAIILV